MVLSDLGRKLTSALSNLASAPDVDEALVDEVLKEITAALLESDVNVKLVGTLRNRVKAKVVPLLASKGSTNVRNSLQRAVVDELVALVDPSDGPGGISSATWKPKKKVPNVIMFVGLQGSGKTTSCTKLAVHYQKRGFKTCLVCADTFRAGAYDQLKQNATKARVPFFGSYTETDPVVISGQGVEKFKSERFEVIIVDTSGRHRQETELFDEMKQISAAVTPDLTIMVLDGAIGQAAESQSKAFKEAADFGAIIVTKMDGHARGGGAISAVAATRTPIMFIGTGEHTQDLERFEPRPFISKLLGMGDVGGLMEKVREAGMADPAKQETMRKKLEAGGAFTLRDMRDQLTNVSKLGPLSSVASMLPGGIGQMMAGMGGNDADTAAQMRKLICIADAMTNEELDSDGKLFEAHPPRPEGAKDLVQGQGREPNQRVLRVARGSGTSVDMVEQFLAQHRMFVGVAKRMGGKAGLANAMSGAGRGRGGGMPGASQLAAMQNMLPAHLRGPGGMAQLQQMAQQMGMGGGGGGMPDMAKMQQMMASMGMGGAAR